MAAILTADKVDLLAELDRYRGARPPGADGALASFIGSMRELNAGQRISRMTLEHYPAMTQRFLDKLCESMRERFDLNDILIVHRVGELEPGDDIVLVACWSAHRAGAFDACREAMEQLKSEAPFWKHENTDSGERWVHDIEQGADS